MPADVLVDLLSGQGVPVEAQRFLGRLHPLLVHFPVALLLVAGLVELVRLRSPRGPAQVALVCLALGAPLALASGFTGWLNAAYEPQGVRLEQVLAMHRWVGVVTAATALLVLGAGLLARGGMGWARVPYRGGLVALLLLVPFCGHLGGSLVFGPEYLTEVLRTPRTAGEGEDAPEPEPPPAPDERSYRDVIQPLLERSCYSCHGPEKQKGGLALHRMADVFAGDPDMWVIVPGEPDASLLIELVSLPPDHRDRMPADGAPLARGEIEMLRQWVAAGARYVDPPPAPPAAGGTR